jgi:hypothetical protein
MCVHVVSIYVVLCNSKKNEASHEAFDLSRQEKLCWIVNDCNNNCGSAFEGNLHKLIPHINFLQQFSRKTSTSPSCFEPDIRMLKNIYSHLTQPHREVVIVRISVVCWSYHKKNSFYQCSKGTLHFSL